jgi:hypothetical protein
MMRRALLSALLMLGGCAYHRVVVAVPNPPDQTYHAVRSSALGWGAVEQTSTAKNCPTNLLSEVRVRTSLAQSLGTVLTLGLWQPVTIEYRCSRLPTQVIEP